VPPALGAPANKVGLGARFGLGKLWPDPRYLLSGDAAACSDVPGQIRTEYHPRQWLVAGEKDSTQVLGIRCMLHWTIFRDSTLRRTPRVLG
jgi:hypothetical protein